MKQFPMYKITCDGKQKEVDWTELNQLKKDILWVFDENTTDLFNAYIPKDSFQRTYWEYLSLNGDKFFYEDEKDFYIQGVLIIILCMTIQYIDTTSGNQDIFGESEIDFIIKCIKDFKPRNPNQNRLKDIVVTRLKTANKLTKDDLINKEYDRGNLDDFIKDLKWIDSEFIQSYFRSLIV